ncbi:uncharacterized protein BJ171DRAFT_275320 [Polychytrium aggregatum]|uniref:uncharacterized protein n=1 Tax=Polychytrium aggregatum TaxID=110093 RepID=UPI0022FDF8B3|nr:uncharacterized protein BJ171DRAFT_275320 [Polychytrium aggregatum]KAI9207420.1 hypothetical protein BJ171DRAFT_275320 [Polychytrium aggregatum]
MENEPLADFEMAFYNGYKLHSSTAKQRIELRIPKEPSGAASGMAHASKRTDKVQSEYATYAIDLKGTESSIPPELLPYFRHGQYCLKICLDVETSAKLDPSVKYPLILKSSTTPTQAQLPAVDRIETSPTQTLFQGYTTAPSTVYPDSLSDMSTPSSAAAGTPRVGRYPSRSGVAGTLSSSSCTGTLRRAHSDGTLQRAAPPTPTTWSSAGSSIQSPGKDGQATPSPACPSTTTARTDATNGAGSLGSLRTEGRKQSHPAPAAPTESYGRPSTYSSIKNRHPARDAVADRGCKEAPPGRESMPELAAAAQTQVPKVSPTCSRSGVSTPTDSTHTRPSRSSRSKATEPNNRVGLGGATESHTMDEPRMRFLPGVGWCSFEDEHSGVFKLMFVDGTLMTIDSKDQTLGWRSFDPTAEICPGHEPSTRYAINEKLPAAVKSKLGHFAEFLQASSHPCDDDADAKVATA